MQRTLKNQPLENSMKTLRILSGVEIDGKHVDENSIVENVPNEIAAELIVAGRAEVVPNQGSKIIVPDPVVENRDPKPAPSIPQPKPGSRTNKPKPSPIDAPPKA
jgi:hypothetical protein